MAGPIKISILADVGKAVSDITKFSQTVDENTHRVVTGLGDSKLTGGFGKMQEGFDVLDTRAMGFRDTITGVQDSMTGFQAIMGQGSHASDTFGDKLLLLGTGIGDLASGFANFIVPMAAVASSLNAVSLAGIRSTAALVAQKVAMVAGAVVTGVMTAAQWALNVAMSANPIGLIILAVVALVAAVVLAWKHSETFRTIVTAAFNAVWSVVQGVWGWIKDHWQLLLQILVGPIGIAVRWITQHWATIRAGIAAVWGWITSHWQLLFGILTGPVGTAVRWIVSHFGQIVSTASAIIGKIRGVFSAVGGLLKDAGRRLIQGFVDGIKSMFGAVSGALGWITDHLPSWKGPPARDRVLLAGVGEQVIGGFITGMRSQFGAARAELQAFTTDLGGAVDARVGGRVTIAEPAAPGWARKLSDLLDGGITITLRSSGTLADDALVQIIADRITARGGRGSAIGITSL